MKHHVSSISLSVGKQKKPRYSVILGVDFGISLGSAITNLFAEKYMQLSGNGDVSWLWTTARKLLLLPAINYYIFISSYLCGEEPIQHPREKENSSLCPH